MARDPAQSFQQALQVISASVQPRLDQAGEAISAQAERVDQEVRKNPWAFIGGAAVLALLIGFFLGRRSK